MLPERERVCRALALLHVEGISNGTAHEDMVRAGISLPALMQLMGHADIQTTLRYVQITPQDVYVEYARAVAQHTRPVPKISS